MLVIPDDWHKRWQGRDPFDQLFKTEGSVYREREGRKTLKFRFGDKYYFAKFHRGVGWKEILKNIIQFRLPVISAKNEWEAIKRLNELGVNTACLVGYGRKGWNPATVQSFVVMEELVNSISLEDFCLQWQESPPSYVLKKALITEVAKIARTLHENGLNHRDFYICHFLLDIPEDKNPVDPRRLRLNLIDLHRMQIRRRAPKRWRIKDIAGLYYSSMGIGLTERDLLRFIRVYRRQPVKVALKEDKAFWRRVKKRGDELYREGVRKNRNEISYR